MRLSVEVRDRTFAGVFRGTSAREIVGGLPDDWTACRVVTSGRRGQGLGDFVSAAAERVAGSTGVWLTAWAFTDHALLDAWIGRWGLDGIRVVSDSFQVVRRKAGAANHWDRVIDRLGGWDAGRVRVGAVHAKFAYLVGTDCVVSSSGNVEHGGNNRIEQVELARDPEWAAAVRQWFEVVWETTEPGELGRTVMDRQLRHGHALAVAARAGTAAGSALAPEGGASSGRGAPAPADPPASGRPQTVGQLSRRLRGRVQSTLDGVTEASDLPALSLTLRRAQVLERTDVARRERAERELAELRLSRERAGWLPVAAVVDGFGAEHVRLRDALLALAERARLETVEGDDVIAWFDREVRSALLALSRGAPPPGMPAAVADALREAGREAAGKGATG